MPGPTKPEVRKVVREDASYYSGVPVAKIKDRDKLGTDLGMELADRVHLRRSLRDYIREHNPDGGTVKLTSNGQAPPPMRR